MLTFLVFRRINFANATPYELEQLTQACETFKFEGTHCNAGMDPECFSASLDPFQTDIIKTIRGYLLEGDESTKNMKAEPHKLNVYGTHWIFVHASAQYYVAV